MGQSLINKTGMFADGCRWRLLPEAQQTWATFKMHFARQERDRLETATTASAGYSGAAFAVTPSIAVPTPPNNPDATLAPPTPAFDGAANAVAHTPTGAELAALIAELTRLRAATRVPTPASNTTAARGYCWTHGSIANSAHTSATCRNRAEGHVDTATWRNKCGGNTGTFVPSSRRDRN
jgi:hypothetical protein